MSWKQIFIVNLNDVHCKGGTCQFGNVFNSTWRHRGREGGRRRSLPGVHCCRGIRTWHIWQGTAPAWATGKFGSTCRWRWTKSCRSWTARRGLAPCPVRKEIKALIKIPVDNKTCLSGNFCNFHSLLSFMEKKTFSFPFLRLWRRAR